jgi:short-subunit dehydrogenase
VSAYGSWALIAGGSEGVGSAFARLLAREGINSVLVARKPDALATTAAEVEASGAQVRTLAIDLLSADALDEIALATADLDLGLLIVNAGANSYGAPYLDGSLEDFQRVVDLNVTLPMALVHRFAPALRSRGRGGIVVVGSLAGYVGQPEIGVYAAAKAFQRVFTESLWLELQPFGIDVLHLVLGVTRTPAMERAGLLLDLPGLVAADPDDVAAEGWAQLPHGPVHVVGDNLKTAERLSRFPRGPVVTGHAEMIRKLRP